MSTKQLSTTILILALFEDDSVALRPRDIMERTGRKSEVVRTSLKRLQAKGLMHHVGHGWWAKSPTALVPQRPGDRLKALEDRVSALEGLVTHYVRLGKL